MQEANKLITVLVHVCIRHVHTEGFPWLFVDAFGIRLHYAPSCPSCKQVKRQDDAHADSSTRPVIVTAHSTSLWLRLGAQIQGWKIKFTSTQPLDNKRSMIIAFEGLLACTLEDVYKIL